MIGGRRGLAHQRAQIKTVAESYGFPYLRGPERPSADKKSWLTRFTREADGSGPALFVGFTRHGTDMERLRDDLATLSLGAAKSVADLDTGLLGEWLYVLQYRGMIA